ncbi:MAG: polysaccharide biosynthesis protein CapD, partial [Proteobacteria bacterium]|nr:polysaccharide biosynthesis protein CapD [Pseudomonadota bacterium]
MKTSLNWRNAIAFAHDAAAAAAAWAIAYLLRFNFDVPPQYEQAMLSNLAWLVPMQAVIFAQARMYRGLWRYASLIDLRRIVLSAIAGAVGIGLVAFVARRPDIPRSVIALYPLLLAGAMAGSRLAYRSWKEGHLSRLETTETKRVVILGAGRAAANLLRSVGTNPEWRFVGLLDDDAAKRGRDINGVKVLGRLDDLPALAESLEIDQAIVAMPSQSHSVRRRAVDICTRAGVAALTVPAYEDIVSGRVRASSVRRVELEDLLGRDPVQLDTDGLARFIGGKCVLVTGAGGSIGSELCRQIARHRPEKLVLLELNEFALYQIH